MKALNTQTKIARTGAFSLIFIFFALHTTAQSINQNWKKDLEASLVEFKNCEKSGGNGNPCARFMGQSLKTVYKVDDFYSKEVNRYLYVSEISKYLQESGQWTNIGHAYEQNALNKAQENANANIATVAVYLHTSGVGHVVVILPGSLHSSGSWGFQVPNTSSFFAAAPDRSFVNKGLSYAFTKGLMKDVVLYSRKY
ncbi:MAG: hypothetical protein AAFN93_19085 [Bacteroidota bacterium]